MRVERIVEYNKNKVGSIASSQFSPWQTFCLGNYILANPVISVRGAGLISSTREASTQITFIC